MKIVLGNIFETKAKTIVNTVNCVGVMGKGIALEFKKLYPEMFLDYKFRCDNHLVKPGQPYLYTDLTGVSIINFPTKDDWRSQSKIGYIASGLQWFVDNYKELGITSVAFPPLGCGNGGLLWEDVGPLMYKLLNPLPIDIELYPPYGTKKEYLTEEYLSSNFNIQRYEGVKTQNLKNESFCILEIINKLNHDNYASYVGRVMYQKICYFATIEGLKTGFMFKQYYFGPYSDDAKKAFNAFSNSNLIYEKKIGKMDAIILTDHYKTIRDKYKNTFSINEVVINKITDLFSRIRDTKQAEVYATILYAYHNIKNKNRDSILEYVKKWKKTWSSGENFSQLQEGIDDLISINYIRL